MVLMGNVRYASTAISYITSFIGKVHKFLKAGVAICRLGSMTAFLFADILYSFGILFEVGNMLPAKRPRKLKFYATV